MDRIEDCVSFLLGKASQRVTRRARELLAGHDVTPVQYAALCVLWQRDGQTSAELGARLAIDSATMTGIIDRLERAKLIERRGDKTDRRIHRLHLTTQGQELRAPLDEAMDRLNNEIAGLLGAQSERFYQMLRQVGDIA